MTPAASTPTPDSAASAVTTDAGGTALNYYSDGFEQTALDEMFRPDGSIRPHYRGIGSVIGGIGQDHLQARLDALGRAFIDQGITFALSGQERPVPAGSGPPRHRRQRVVAPGGGHRAAGEGARDVPRRRLRRAGDPGRRHHAAPPHLLVRALPPVCGGHPTAERRPHPRRGHRPDP